MHRFLIIVHCRHKQGGYGVRPRQYSVEAESAGAALDIAHEEIQKTEYQAIRYEVMVDNTIIVTAKRAVAVNDEVPAPRAQAPAKKRK